MKRFSSSALAKGLMFTCAQLIAASAQGTCSVHSGPTTPHLVELYTSEGCSSCPPAEKWLDELSDDARVIELEFHVDYWDGLGWPDRFASHRYTTRQQALAAQSGSNTVYTPEVALDGREWRQWSRASLPSPAAAPLALQLDVVSGKHLQAQLKFSETQIGTPALQSYYAIVEGDLVSVIRNGENSGKTLHHSHVVRGFVGPLPVGDRADMDLPADAILENTSVVAFVTNAEHGTVVESIRLPLSGCRGSAVP